MELDTRVDILATILAGVSSDYSDSLAVVANQERFREYDYGPGAGARVDVNIERKGQPFIDAGYRLNFIYVTNGSIYQGDDLGLNARHWLHGVNVRVNSPAIHRGWGVGTEYKSFTRQSHYQLSLASLGPEFHVTQIVTATTPEFLLYAHWSPGSGDKR
jgi:hypothetical protein